MDPSYASYPIDELNLFGACFSGLGLCATCIILIYTSCRPKTLEYVNYVWILTYITMSTYTCSQLATFVNYIYRLLNDNQIHLIIYSSTFFFNFSSMFLVLLVFISRIRLLFQNTPFRYSKQLIYFFYIVISTVPVSSMTTLAFVVYANANKIEPNTGSKIYVIIYCVVAYHLGVYLFCAVALLFMFVKRLIYIEGIEKTGDVENQELLLQLQLKFTVLGIICLGSTAIIATINWSISGTLHYVASDFWLSLFIDIDCIIGVICMAFTIKSNKVLYDKGCWVCGHCIHWMISFCVTNSVSYAVINNTSNPIANEKL